MVGETVVGDGLGVGVLGVGVLGPLEVEDLIVKRVEVPMEVGNGEVPMRGDSGRVGKRDSVAPGVAVGDAKGGASDDNVCGAVAYLPYSFVNDSSDDFGVASIVEDAAVRLVVFVEELCVGLACCWERGRGIDGE